MEEAAGTLRRRRAPLCSSRDYARQPATCCKARLSAHSWRTLAWGLLWHF